MISKLELFNANPAKNAPVPAASALRRTQDGVAQAGQVRQLVYGVKNQGLFVSLVPGRVIALKCGNFPDEFHLPGIIWGSITPQDVMEPQGRCFTGRVVILP
jgi:hypothetical protein